jgi:hypothetical protein
MGIVISTWTILWWNVAWEMPVAWRNVRVGLTRGEIYALLDEGGKLGSHERMLRTDYFDDDSYSIWKSRFRWSLLIKYDNGDGDEKKSAPAGRGVRFGDKVVEVRKECSEQWLLSFWPPGIRRKWQSM